MVGLTNTRPAVRAGLWTLGAILPWATMAAAIESALKSTSSSQLLFWSFLFAAPSAFLWDRLLGGRRPATAGLWMPPVVLALGMLGIFGWTAGVILSLDRAPVIEANLLTYLWPLMMVGLAPLAGERFSSVALAGAVVGFVGAGLVVTEGKGFSVDPAHHLGYALALAAACAWAAFVILLRRRGEPGTRRTPGFVLAALCLATLMALVLDGGISVPAWSTLAAAAWLGLGPMSLSFVCWDRAVATDHLGLVGRMSYLDPLISTLLLMAVLGLAPTAAAWIGMALIMLGIAVPELIEARHRKVAST
ncbi:MAG: hypothetical protein DI534_15895 [Leifsonia xyli]|nr:MAG: hypothetical protein DI534_15895 [Leifsonia xyli]